MIPLTKKILKTILIFFHIDITKNMQYDRQTLKVMGRVIREGSNCIDIGCHKGEMLEIILNFSKNGNHFVFEPIPYLNEKLHEQFNNPNINISKIALSNEKGTAVFNIVKNAPAYSGLKQRKYAIANPEIEQVSVETDLLDNIIPKEINIDFIKIDVEGAEYPVMQGAAETIRRCKPVIIFEFGLGASDYYGTKPEMVYDLLNGTCGLKIFTLYNWLKGKSSLTKDEFRELYENSREYYFLAHS
jgi:FkbM family methyltransferase